jgi:hypothetical protein
MGPHLPASDEGLRSTEAGEATIYRAELLSSLEDSRAEKVQIAGTGAGIVVVPQNRRMKSVDERQLINCSAGSAAGPLLMSRFLPLAAPHC